MSAYKKCIIRGIYITILIFMFILIFYLSSQNGDESSELSGKFISKIIKIFTNNLSTEHMQNLIKDLDFIVRKIAHISLYFIVGLYSILLLNTYTIKSSERILISISIGITYSVFDEIHQTFVKGRSGNFFDVLIDSIGVILGCALVIAFKRIYNNIKNTK